MEKTATVLPTTPNEVRKAIRDSVEEEPFTALRHASESARALHPTSDSLPPTLPAFVLPSHTLMPGERADFIFFEPRYRALASKVLGLGSTPSSSSSSSSSSLPDRRYAHLPAADGVGTVASILDHRVLPDGRIAAHVMAGPRCRVIRGAEAEVIEEGKAPLLHVAYDVAIDEPPVDAAADERLARDCLEKLATLIPIQKLCAVSSNAPPLFCPERLSFWLCQLMIRQDDARLRVAWLQERTTATRLTFLLNALNRRPQESQGV